MLTNLDLIVYGIATFFAAILSGIAGGGGGFITTPLAIFLGLSPAQAIATGKIGGLAVSVSSLTGMKGVKIKSKRRVVVIMLIALVIGIIAPFFIVKLEDDVYRKLLGVLLLLMIPVVITKKIGHESKNPSSARSVIGYILVIATLSLQAVFSGGLGSLVNVVLMGVLGMSAIESNITKRYSQLILNSVIVLGVLRSGLIYWPVAGVGVIAATCGGYIGGKVAVKRGNRFVITVFVVLMFISALELLLG